MSVLKENQKPQFLFFQALNKMNCDIKKMSEHELRERESMFLAGMAQMIGFMRDDIGSESLNEDDAIEMMIEMEESILNRMKAI